MSETMSAQEVVDLLGLVHPARETTAMWTGLTKLGSNPTYVRLLRMVQKAFDEGLTVIKVSASDCFDLMTMDNTMALEVEGEGWYRANGPRHQRIVVEIDKDLSISK